MEISILIYAVLSAKTQKIKFYSIVESTQKGTIAKKNVLIKSQILFQIRPNVYPNAVITLLPKLSVQVIRNSTWTYAELDVTLNH
jgi:hypothetical protein